MLTSKLNDQNRREEFSVEKDKAKNETKGRHLS